MNIGSSPRRPDRRELYDSYYESADDAGPGGALALVGVVAALGLGWWWASRGAKGPDEAQPPQTGPLPGENPFSTPDT